MKKIIYCFLLFLTACGGGGKGGVGPPPPEDESPGGFWVGIDSDGEVVVVFVTESGRFQLFTEFGNQGSGIMTVSNGNDVAANFELVTLFGVTFPDGTTLADCALSGLVTERETMSVTINCTTTAGLDDQYTVMPLDFVPIYERDSSLATIAGNYDDGFGVMMTIASDGTIFAQDPFSNCVVNGQVTIIDLDFNLYDFQFGLNNCVGIDDVLNGTSFVGIGLLDNSFSPEALIVPATGEVGGNLASWFLFGERL